MLYFNSEKEYQRIFKKIISSYKIKSLKGVERRILLNSIREEVSAICKRMSKQKIKKIISNKNSEKVSSYGLSYWHGDEETNRIINSLFSKDEVEQKSSWSHRNYYTDIYTLREIKKVCFNHRYYATVTYKEGSSTKQLSFKKSSLYKFLAEHLATTFSQNEFFSSKEFAKFMLKNGEGLFLYSFLDRRTSEPLRSKSYYLEDSFQRLLIKRLNDNKKSERLKNKLCRVIFKRFSDLELPTEYLSYNQEFALKRNSMTSFYLNPLSYIDLNTDPSSFSHYVNKSWQEEWYVRDFILSTLKIKVLNMSNKKRLKYAFHFVKMTKEVKCNHSQRIFSDILGYTMSMLPRQNLIYFMDVFSDSNNFDTHYFKQERKRLNQEFWR